MSEARSGVLPPAVLRNLGDKSYEKRKQAALEIEHIVKDVKDSAATSSTPSKPSTDPIRAILHTLTKDFAHSTQSNQRKGGLIGLAATSIALMDDAPSYLDALLPPVLRCFSDQESRVRYYACEALYNIAKVARGSVLLHFNDIFDGLCKLYADSDIDVKNGAQLLDRLIKDLVTETDAFDVDKFIPLLKERIRIKNPFIRQLLVGWITVLDSVPDIDMVEFLPEYLGGLFDMLSDPNKDIRQQAYAALAELLRELINSPHVELSPMVGILVTHAGSVDNFTRLTVLTWLHEFIILDKGKLLPLVSDVLGVTLNCLSDSEKEIRVKSEKTNEALLRLVEGNPSESLNYSQLINRVTQELSSKYTASRIASLRWVQMLLTKNPQAALTHLGGYFPALLKLLGDADDSVVRLSLEVLARVSVNESSSGKNLDDERFDMVLTQVIALFQTDRRFLEARGSLIIRALCELLDAEAIYLAVAKLLLSNTDCEFASLMVQTMNLILLTSSELFQLRGRLKAAMGTPEGRALFLTLYRSWCHNPVSTFSLCLLTQCYGLAGRLIPLIAELDITVGQLMQIDTLIQLIESPIFIHLRLHLLEPRRYPALVRGLYGLLMLLPQSSAFVSLQTRLQSVSALAMIGSEVGVVDEGAGLDEEGLVEHFRGMQAKHAKKRADLFLSQSLLHRKDSGTQRSENGR